MPLANPAKGHSGTAWPTPLSGRGPMLLLLSRAMRLRLVVLAKQLDARASFKLSFWPSSGFVHSYICLSLYRRILNNPYAEGQGNFQFNLYSPDCKWRG